MQGTTNISMIIHYQFLYGYSQPAFLLYIYIITFIPLPFSSFPSLLFAMDREIQSVGDPSGKQPVCIEPSAFLPPNSNSISLHLSIYLYLYLYYYTQRIFLIHPSSKAILTTDNMNLIEVTSSRGHFRSINLFIHSILS